MSVPFQKRQPSSKQLRQSAHSHSGEDACISRKKKKKERVIKGRPHGVIFTHRPPHLVGADVPVQLRRLLDPPVQLGQTELQPAPPAAQRGPLSQPSPLPAAGGKEGEDQSEQPGPICWRLQNNSKVLNCGQSWLLPSQLHEEISPVAQQCTYCRCNKVTDHIVGHVTHWTTCDLL